MTQKAPLFIGRIVGPEVDLETRLKARVLLQLVFLETALRSNHALNTENVVYDSIGDALAELAFNLRRLIEVRRDDKYAKSKIIGYSNGKKTESFWSFLGICHHLMAFHMLIGKSGSYDQSSMLVVHSERKSLGVYPSDLFDAYKYETAKETKRHYGLFSADMISKTLDEDGYPLFNFIISSRSKAINGEKFFWTPLAIIFPGLVIKDVDQDRKWVLERNPALKDDPIFNESFYQTVIAQKRDPR